MPIYAHVKDGAIDQTGALPSTYWDGTRWWDLRGATNAVAAQAGWLPVTTTPRPDDTATQTSDYSVQLVDGVPTETWTPRAKTAAEQNAAQIAEATSTIQAQLQAGIAQIKAARDAAQADAATAATLKTQAESLSTTIAARKTAVDASTPAATVAYVTAIKGELSWIDAQLKVIADAMAAMYAYRGAVDDNAVLTDNALLWLAKQVSGDVLADED